MEQAIAERVTRHLIAIEPITSICIPARIHKRKVFFCSAVTHGSGHRPCWMMVDHTGVGTRMRQLFLCVLLIITGFFVRVFTCT